MKHRFKLSGRRFIGGLLLALALAPAAHAHKPSDAYLTLRVNAETIEQRLDIALRDLDRDLTLDADDDGELRWGEVRGRWPEIERLADAGVQLAAEGRDCRVVALDEWLNQGTNSPRFASSRNRAS